MKDKARKIEESNRATFNIKTKDIQEVNAKQFLTVKEVSVLLQISRRTAYRLVKSKVIPSVRISERITLIRRIDIDNLFLKEHEAEVALTPQEIRIEDCYSLSEAVELFNISSSALYKLIQREGIQKLKKGKHVYVPKAIIDGLLKK